MMRIMGESDEGGDGFSVTLEIARQAAEATDPGQGSFDDAALGQNLEANGRSESTRGRVRSN